MKNVAVYICFGLHAHSFFDSMSCLTHLIYHPSSDELDYPLQKLKLIDQEVTLNNLSEGEISFSGSEYMAITQDL